MHPKRLLDISESVSVLSSIAGLIATIVSQQIVYVAIPLLLSLSLTLLNRRQYKLQIAQKLEETQSMIYDIQQTVTQLTLQNHEQLKVLKLKQSIASKQDRSIASIQKDLDTLSSSYQSDIQTLKTGVKKQFLEVQKLITNQSKQLSKQTTQQLSETLVSRLDQLQAEVEHVQKDFASVAQQSGASHRQSLVKSCKSSTTETVPSRLLDATEKQAVASLEQQIIALTTCLKNISSGYDYRLVFDRNQSRQHLLRAAEKTNDRLILVCPWLHWGVRWDNDHLLDLFKQSLEKPETKIDIGWGLWDDLKNLKGQSGTYRELLQSSELYSALGLLIELEQQYPDRFRLKLLGTHEKFLVCDRQFAMVGSHNFLSSSDSSPEREAGLYTTDLRIVDDLIRRFDRAPNLDKLPRPKKLKNS